MDPPEGVGTSFSRHLPGTVVGVVTTSTGSPLVVTGTTVVGKDLWVGR